MYAIIKTGGKQYTVAQGDKVRVEALAAEAGDKIDLIEVLAIKDDTGLKVGTPLIEGAVVKATVIENGRHPKVRIFKFRRRKHSMKGGSHRQDYTELQIDSIHAQAPVEPEKTNPEQLPVVETPATEVETPATEVKATTTEVETSATDVKASTEVKAPATEVKATTTEAPATEVKATTTEAEAPTTEQKQ